MKRKEKKIMKKTNSGIKKFQPVFVGHSHKHKLVHKMKLLQNKNVCLPDLKDQTSNVNKAKNYFTTSGSPQHQIRSHLNPTVVLNKCDEIVQYSQLSNSDNSQDHILNTKTFNNMNDKLMCNIDSSGTASPLASAPCQQTKKENSTRLSGTKFKVISEWRPYKPKLKISKLKQESMQFFENPENPENMNNEGSSNVENRIFIKRESTLSPISMSEKSGNQTTSNLQPITLVSDKTTVLKTPDIKPSVKNLLKAAATYQCQSANIKPHDATKIGQNSLEEDIYFTNNKLSLITPNHLHHSNNNCNNQLQHPEDNTKSTIMDTCVRKVSSKHQGVIFEKSIFPVCQYTESTPDSSNPLDQQAKHKTSKSSPVCSGLPTYGSIYSTSKLDAIQHLKDSQTNYITSIINILIQKYPTLKGLLSDIPLTDKRLIKVFSNILKKAKRFENSSCKIRKKIFLRTVFNFKMNLDTSNWKSIEEEDEEEEEETSDIRVINLEKSEAIRINSCNNNSTLKEMDDEIKSSNNQFGNVVSCMTENSSILKSYDLSISKPVQHNTVTQRTDVAVQEILLESCSTGHCDLSQNLSHLKARYLSALAQLTKKNKLINELEKRLEQLNNKQKKYTTKIEKYRMEMIELDTFLLNQTALVAYNKT